MCVCECLNNHREQCYLAPMLKRHEVALYVNPFMLVCRSCAKVPNCQLTPYQAQPIVTFRGCCLRGLLLNCEHSSSSPHATHLTRCMWWYARTRDSLSGCSNSSRPTWRLQHCSCLCAPPPPPHSPFVCCGVILWVCRSKTLLR